MLKYSTHVKFHPIEVHEYNSQRSGIQAYEEDDLRFKNKKCPAFA